MGVIASQITSLTIVYSSVYSDALTQIKENIKALRRRPLNGEFTETAEFPAQMASNAENVSIWWRHHDMVKNNLRSHTEAWTKWPTFCRWLGMQFHNRNWILIENFFEDSCWWSIHNKSSLVQAMVYRLTGDRQSVGWMLTKTNGVLWLN